MGTLIADGDAFLDLFSSFTSAARRLEVRRSYGVAEEDEPFQIFLAGADPDTAWFRPWLDLMSRQTGSGKRVERVRVVDDPPSDYLRFEIAHTPLNLAAGEDIRYLLRDASQRLDLPPYDYWIFDDRLLVFLRFDKSNRFLGFERTEVPEEVARHLNSWDIAWRHAMKFDLYRAWYPRMNGR
ncbi:hypothetical protein NE236_00820 [Actinoallomurus purpureus]|uniref:DUF6879 family protein n=1 Tax=Actinoallomurus purpureus TaxID=478114 RepID=UPI00209316EB|nr:DUF6879 family protein [Actinoallomurus purpureus]MCO6003519.1 hypothetical protein [Actinoallomurus purpureus]